MTSNLVNFTDVLGEEEHRDSQPLSLSLSQESQEPTGGKSWQDEALSRDENVANIQMFPSDQIRPHTFQDLDPKYKEVFSHPKFNEVQSRVLDDALFSDASLVVCAPTGSGKTVIFEMAIVQLLMELEAKRYNEDFKVIYMAPVKALCTERLTEWYPKFTKLGLPCIEATGDTDVDFDHLKPYKIVITTPEKWDSLTRRWRDYRALAENIKLFLIDEVHILNDEQRGPVLEAVVSRMKTIEASAQSAHRIEGLQRAREGNSTRASGRAAPRIRFVALSASVGNPEDVAAWLGSPHATVHKFGEETRPVRLNRVVEGFPCADGASAFKFDIALSYKLWPLIQKYHDGKPTLIFCSTRKSVQMTADILSRQMTTTLDPRRLAQLREIASNIRNKKLQALVLSGVGCHHAGLLSEERASVERAFRDRLLPILITTTTLAMGVNLPAHLVIIKNTQQYVNGTFQEYSISTVLQMMGRAGRPQFDTSATAVIMTRNQNLSRYRSLVGGGECLQSFLLRGMGAHLTAEVASGSVGDVAQCVRWLRSTFLWVRARRDPQRYLSLPPNAPTHLLIKKLEEMCVKVANGLASAGLIAVDEASCLEATEAGRLMSSYCLDSETMKTIMKIDGSESLERMLVAVCECRELSESHLRVDERRCLNTLNRSNQSATIRFPMKGKITTKQMKANCLIQAVLGGLPIPDPALNQEATKIMRIADRICKCIVSYLTRASVLSQKGRSLSAVLSGLQLAKCVACRLWEDSALVSRQLRGIGPALSALLAGAGKTNFLLLEESHPRDLERIMNKGPPAGNVLRKQVSLLPKYEVQVVELDERSACVTLVLCNQAHLEQHLDQLTAGAKHKSHLVVGDSDNHLLLLASFTDYDLINVYDGKISFNVTRLHTKEHKLFAYCISTKIAGIDARTDFTFKSLEEDLPPTILEVSQCNDTTKKKIKRQTQITETFKEKKRKVTEHSSPKTVKKRQDWALKDTFDNLKRSFGVAPNTPSINVCNALQLAQNNSNKVTCEMTSSIFDGTLHNHASVVDQDIYINETISDYRNKHDDAHINNILSEIENEISNTHKTKPCFSTFKGSKENLSNKQGFKKNDANKNFNFLDRVGKTIESLDEEVSVEKPTGFSDMIKSKVNDFVQNAKTNIKVPQYEVNSLIEDHTRPLCVSNSLDPISKSLKSSQELEVQLYENMEDDFIENNLVKTSQTFEKNDEAVAGYKSIESNEGKPVYLNAPYTTHQFNKNLECLSNPTKNYDYNPSENFGLHALEYKSVEEKEKPSFEQKEQSSNLTNGRNFVKSYSFTQTKLDRISKTIANHQINITKKIKVDVDITAVISEDINSSMFFEEKINPCSFPVPLLSGNKTQTCLVAKRSANQMANKEISRQMTGLGGCLTIENKDSQSNKEKFPKTDAMIVEVRNTDLKDIFPKQPSTDIILTEEKAPSMPDKSSFNQFQNVDSVGAENLKYDESVSKSLNSTTPTDNTRIIDNILQKYKNNYRPINSEIEQPVREYKINNSQKKVARVPEKPFKITEIHLTNTPINEALFTSNQNSTINETENYKVDDNAPKMCLELTPNILDANNAKFEIPANTSFSEGLENSFNDEFCDIDNDLGISIENYADGKNIEAEAPMQDLTLNPKLLLQNQSQSVSEEIIPPPLPFSDSVFISSPIQNQRLEIFNCYSNQSRNFSDNLLTKQDGESQNCNLNETKATTINQISTWNLLEKNRFNTTIKPFEANHGNGYLKQKHNLKSKLVKFKCPVKNKLKF